MWEDKVYLFSDPKFRRVSWSLEAQSFSSFFTSLPFLCFSFKTTPPPLIWCGFDYLHVCNTYRDQRRALDPRNWSYRWLCANTCLLGIELKSSALEHLVLLTAELSLLPLFPFLNLENCCFLRQWFTLEACRANGQGKNPCLGKKFSLCRETRVRYNTITYLYNPCTEISSLIWGEKLQQHLIPELTNKYCVFKTWRWNPVNICTSFKYLRQFGCLESRSKEMVCTWFNWRPYFDRFLS